MIGSFHLELFRDDFELLFRVFRDALDFLECLGMIWNFICRC